MMKRGIKGGSILFTGVILVFFATSVWAAYNMVMDHRVYQYSGHKAKKQYPVMLQIKVVKDNRPEKEKVQKDDEHPYTYDALWPELVDEMLAKVLEKEFGQSGLATAVDLRMSRPIMSWSLNSIPFMADGLLCLDPLSQSTTSTATQNFQHFLFLEKQIGLFLKRAIREDQKLK